MKNEVLLVTGTSGTGKTTVCKEIKKLGFEAIGIDETPHLSYWVDNKGEVVVGDDVVFDDDFLENHQWVCDLAVLEKLVAKAQKPVVVCGSSDNIKECMAMCDITLLLTCPPETFLERIRVRTDNEYGKTEAAEKALLGYYERYNRECVEAGAISINADRPIGEVVNEIISYL